MFARLSQSVSNLLAGLFLKSKWHAACEVLSNRQKFDVIAWQSSGIDASWAQEVCMAISEALDFPNNFFLPTDPISYFFRDDAYDFGQIELVDKLNLFTNSNILGIEKITRALGDRKATIKDFLLVLQEHKDRSKVSGTLNETDTVKIESKLPE